MVDDDEVLTQSVKDFFSREGDICITERFDGMSGVEAALAKDYDVIVLDVSMPKMNGFDALKEIRKHKDTPVLMLTARGDDFDRIVGFEIGADDYVPKPCHLRELYGRIKAIYRRTSGSKSNESENVIILGDLKIKTSSQSVEKNGEHVSLTGAEFLVLEVLAQSAGQVIDKDTISKHALGRRSMPYDRSVDAHVGHLRKKLGPLPNGQQRIKTVRGKGYLYVA